MRFISSIFFILLFNIHLFAQFSDSDYSGKLKIGILRHITIDEAEQMGTNNEAEKMIVAEAESRGHHIEFINPLQLVYSTIEHSDYDVIISRAEIDTFTANITDSYLRASDYFQISGIPVINSAIATINAQDKFRTLLLAQKAGVRTPMTFIVHALKEVESLLHVNRIHYPFFIKKPYGGKGTGVFLVEDHQRLTELIDRNFNPESLFW